MIKDTGIVRDTKRDTSMEREHREGWRGWSRDVVWTPLGCIGSSKLSLEWNRYFGGIIEIFYNYKRVKLLDIMTQ